jgi:hypothetical protein
MAENCRPNAASDLMPKSGYRFSGDIMVHRSDFALKSALTAPSIAAQRWK